MRGKFLLNKSNNSSFEIFPNINRISFFGVLDKKCEFLKSKSFVTRIKSWESANNEIAGSLLCHFWRIKFT